MCAPMPCPDGTVTPAGQSPGLPAAPPEDRDGTLSIEGGVPAYHAPAGAGAYPVIEPGTGVRVYHNDTLVTAPRVVFRHDVLRFEVEDQPPVVTVEVRVPPDEMTAELVVERRPGARHRVADAEPRRVLRPKAVQVEVEPARMVTLEEAMLALRQAGVCFGVNIDDVQRAVAAANESPSTQGHVEVVAQGQPPVPAQDSTLQLIGGLSPGDVVESGEPLVRKMPAVEGKPGTTVRGNPIPVAPPKELALRPGDGVELSPDGLTATASRPGRLIVRGPLVTVRSVHHVPGDLDQRASPLHFPGDISVEGMVGTGCAVQAGGVVEVRQSIDSSEIKAGEAIRCLGAVFRSNLVAGVDMEIDAAALQATLQTISLELRRLHQMVCGVIAGTGWQERDVIRSVLERKGTALREAVKALSKHPASSTLPDHLPELLAARVGGTPGTTAADLAELGSLATRVESALDLLSTCPPVEASVWVPYAHNSVIKASGTIHLTGRGSYQSVLHAGTGVVSQAGDLVGGEVVVRKGDVTCHALGGPRSVTRVSVAEGFHIQAATVIPDVRVEVGGRRLTVTRPLQSVSFGLEDGRIVARACVR